MELSEPTKEEELEMKVNYALHVDVINLSEDQGTQLFALAKEDVEIAAALWQNMKNRETFHKDVRVSVEKMIEEKHGSDWEKGTNKAGASGLKATKADDVKWDATIIEGLKESIKPELFPFEEKETTSFIPDTVKLEALKMVDLDSYNQVMEACTTKSKKTAFKFDQPKKKEA